MQAKTAISLLAYPKINLALDILGRDEGGYHLVQTVLHEVRGELFDEVQIEMRKDGKIIVECDNPEVPVGPESLMMRVIERMREIAGADALSGVSVFLKKRIPIAAGLGGGSSDVAALLKGLAQLWKMRDCVFGPRVRGDAAEFGCDVPFFLFGGTALGEHFGEKITTLPAPKNLSFEITDTGVRTSSKDAYAALDLSKCGKNEKKTAALIAALRSEDSQGVFENLHNDFADKNTPLMFLAGSGGCLYRVIRNSAAP